MARLRGSGGATATNDDVALGYAFIDVRDADSGDVVSGARASLSLCAAAAKRFCCCGVVAHARRRLCAMWRTHARVQRLNVWALDGDEAHAPLLGVPVADPDALSRFVALGTPRLAALRATHPPTSARQCGGGDCARFVASMGLAYVAAALARRARGALVCCSFLFSRLLAPFEI